MQIFQGKAVSHGITMGPIVVWQKDEYITEHRQVADSEAECVRLDGALELSKAQLLKMQETVTPEKEFGSVTERDKSICAIFEAQSMLLEDEGFVGQIRTLIRSEHMNAEYAVVQAGNRIAEMFAAMEDAYMREREADIRDIVARILRNLQGEEDAIPVLAEPSVILAEELTPGETVQFDREKVLAFVTAQGSANSHAAILARSMGIPMLVGVDIVKVSEDICGRMHTEAEMCVRNEQTAVFAIADAIAGQLILKPDSKTIEEYKVKMQQEQVRNELLQMYRNQESITLDGHKIHICANVGTAAEVQEALEIGADGIGLFRSEFLYLGRENFPTEEELYQEYTKALICMGEKRVIIRTIDVGADKQAGYFGLEPESNPALGCRGIRVCLRRPDILKTQLRALFRAAVHGNLAIMYPMITDPGEVEQIAKIVNDVTKELKEQGISYKVPSQGIMIETPAAVMVSDELAEMVDFFSIGTNDLTQYTLAMDRQNSNLEDFYHPRHKAILRMIQMVIANAHKAGKWVGICGELAADTAITETLVHMGVDELSVVCGKVLELRKMVREMNVQE